MSIPAGNGVLDGPGRRPRRRRPVRRRRPTTGAARSSYALQIDHRRRAVRDAAEAVGRPAAASAPATTADLLALSEQVSGQQLDALFDAWLYQPTKPAAP